MISPKVTTFIILKFLSKKINYLISDGIYFTVDKLYLDGVLMGSVKGMVDKSSFVSILFMEGEGQISCGGEVLPYRKGDSFLLTADSGEYEVCGSCEALVTTIRS